MLSLLISDVIYDTKSRVSTLSSKCWKKKRKKIKFQNSNGDKCMLAPIRVTGECYQTTKRDLRQ